MFKCSDTIYAYANVGVTNLGFIPIITQKPTLMKPMLKLKIHINIGIKSLIGYGSGTNPKFWHNYCQYWHCIGQNVTNLYKYWYKNGKFLQYRAPIAI